MRDMCGRVGMGHRWLNMGKYIGWSGPSPDMFVVLVMKNVELRKSCRKRSYRSWLNIINIICNGL